jgi:Fe-Mn family superoxide dismutase
MKLHEFYFAALGGDGTPKGELVGMIERDFGFVDAWKEEMVATGLSARGWAVLCYDYGDMKLHIYSGDAHNIGAVWNCAIILPLDVYEHSYFIDYAVDRKAYIESFFKNLNWDFLNGLVKNWSLK